MHDVFKLCATEMCLLHSQKKKLFTVKGVKFKTHATFELLIIYSQKSIQHTPSQYTPSFIFHPIMINTILGKKEKNKNHL